ncbi:MAG: transcriptional repressor [Bifidobacteriaceae bacterium]|nr:transcriptional repressor [Bifidobacteriaceae bacterium]
MTRTIPVHPRPRRTARRKTKQQIAIVGVLRGKKEFWSATQIYNELRTQGSTVGLATVYRTLAVLAAEGELDALQHPGTTETLYRACGDLDHHHHLTCRECGLTVEVKAPEIEAFARSVAAGNGFGDVDHTLEITGTCPSCATP